MKKSSLAIATFAVLLSGCAAIAGEGMTESSSMQQHQEMMGMGMGMSKMDANNDGVISKQEFKDGHERMFDHMKNKDGVIDAKMMENCSMMGGEKMKGHSMMENSPMMDGHMPHGHKQPSTY